MREVPLASDTAPSAAASLTLPWLAAPLRDALATQHTHALLLHGPQGVGQFEMALTLAQAWLCESKASADGDAPRPCSVCASCRLVQARSHPDLLVLIPELLSSVLGWNTDAAGEEVGSGAVDAAGKRKPSKEIRVAEVRRILAFAHTTAAREHGKVVVVYPAEAMNTIAANALLKILEEPTGRLRFVLAGSSADTLLPTIRSRCQSLWLGVPDAEMASAWLRAQGVAQPEVLLAAAGGQPQEALSWFRDGIAAESWLALPTQLAHGDAASLPTWPLARVVDMMFKLCHDAMRMAVGASPRYFPAQAMRGVADHAADIGALGNWYRELGRIARHSEHPWQAALTIESLVLQAKTALAAKSSSTRVSRSIN
ncbi:MAG: DNA polymerase III subunit delta' [Burkholderiales bacterium]